MAQPRKSTVLPFPVLVFVDVMGLVLTVGPGAVAWLVAAAYVRHVVVTLDLWPLAFLFPIIAFVAFTLTLLVFRLIVPRLREGSTRLGVNRQTIAWYCNLALSRAAEVSGLKPLIHAFYFTKFLHWRALGARVGYGVNSSIGVSLVDLPMITIGAGSTLGDEVAIYCHNFDGGKLIVKRVEIGEGVFLGGHCTIGPNTVIGEGSWIGPYNAFIDVSLPPGTRLRPWEWEHGNPNRAGAKASKDPQ